MLGTLEAAISQLEIDPGGDELIEACSLLSRLSAKVTSAVGAFDGCDGYVDWRATSMTAWLRRQCDMVSADAGRFVRFSRLLRQLPVTSSAWQDGVLSEGQVKAILANVTRRTVALFASHEAELVPTLAKMSVGRVARVMQHWASLADDGEDPGEPERWLSMSSTLDGRYEAKGSFDAETGAIIAAALRLAESPDCTGEPRRCATTRRADAMADVCRFFLDHHNTATEVRRNRPHLDVIVELDVEADRLRAEILNGPALDQATIATLLCDSTLHRVLCAGKSTILDYGRGARTATDNQFRALVARDRHCQLFDCDRGPQWCEAHHIVAYEHGGPTDIDNLLLACSRHHHLVHQKGWEVKRLDDGEVHITDPDGYVWINAPP